MYAGAFGGSMGVTTVSFQEPYYPSWYYEKHVVMRPMTKRQRKQLLEEKIEFASFDNDWDNEE